MFPVIFLSFSLFPSLSHTHRIYTHRKNREHLHPLCGYSHGCPIRSCHTAPTSFLSQCSSHHPARSSHCWLEMFLLPHPQLLFCNIHTETTNSPRYEFPTQLGDTKCLKYIYIHCIVISLLLYKPCTCGQIINSPYPGVLYKEESNI